MLLLHKAPPGLTLHNGQVEQNCWNYPGYFPADKTNYIYSAMSVDLSVKLICTNLINERAQMLQVCLKPLDFQSAQIYCLMPWLLFHCSWNIISIGDEKIWRCSSFSQNRNLQALQNVEENSEHANFCSARLHHKGQTALKTHKISIVNPYMTSCQVRTLPAAFEKVSFLILWKCLWFIVRELCSPASVQHDCSSSQERRVIPPWIWKRPGFSLSGPREINYLL